MLDTPTRAISADRRIRLYRLALRTVIFIVAILLVKYLLIDTVVIRTDQMAPALEPGDRCLMLRRGIAALLAPEPRRGDVVIFIPPGAARGSLGALRVAAIAGDSIAVLHGVFINYSHREKQRAQWAVKGDPLPPQYSPRDWLDPYRVPRRGHALSLDSLSARDFFFAASVIRQENPGAAFAIATRLFANGREIPEYTIDGFSLYEGPLGKAPAQKQFDPFFWERVRNHIVTRMSDTAVWLTHTLMRDGAATLNYQMKASCIFLLADDWEKGFDSRYFGPVSVRCVKGRAALVLWSFDPAKRGPAALRWRRLMRLVRSAPQRPANRVKPG